MKNRVYMCFSTDMIHSGHIDIIRKAEKLGDLTIGVLSDEAIASFKRYPLMPFEERKVLFENISGVKKVVEQKELSYKSILLELRPDIVVHGDDWKEGFQKPIRDEVVEILASYGGELVEFPYNKDAGYDELEKQTRLQLGNRSIERPYSIEGANRGEVHFVQEVQGTRDFKKESGV